MKVQINDCARCGADVHVDVDFHQLARPMAPPDITPAIVWSHWAACPVNGEPIMLSVLNPGGTPVAVKVKP